MILQQKLRRNTIVNPKRLNHSDGMFLMRIPCSDHIKRDVLICHFTKMYTKNKWKIKKMMVKLMKKGYKIWLMIWKIKKRKENNLVGEELL